MCGVEKEHIIAEFRRLSKILTTIHGYTPAQVRELLDDTERIPTSIFTTELSPLQAIVTYLHDHKHTPHKTIASLLGRSYRAVWGAYQKIGINIKESTQTIPLNAFGPQKSILESAVWHLKERENLRYNQIAALLGKDQRTIWTVYTRAKKKDEQHS